MTISAQSLSKLVATYALPEIVPFEESANPLVFIVELYLDPSGAYFPKVLRQEKYDLAIAHASIQQAIVPRATEEVLVLETSCEWSEIRCDSESAALEMTIFRLNEMLGLQR